MKATEFIDSFKQIQQKEVSEEAVKILGKEERVKRFSKIESDERDLLFNFLTARRIFFSESKMINDIVNDYLELSLSIDATGANIIVDLFKTEIQAQLIKEKNE